ncbi:uncharacterized protein LOC106090483 [Stomoxys calcitrans]|uniref:uncharacterized protein LOC106090483 n=1 Tax=Stomoxys calcitrans TaxID=35570 RepID=UPI0027E260E8|nr:uncharacterized protein LOC106090483 [Stomoxys calcitrans]
MERHMVFVCPECGQTTETQNEWRQHLNTVHDYARKKAIDFDFKEIDRKYHECQICLKRLAHGHQSPVLLQHHRFTHLPYSGPFKCRYCAGTYVKKRALSVHLFRCHSQLMNKVDNDYKMEKMKQAIALRHPRFNSEFFMRFICPQCGKLLQRFNDWLEHIDKNHLSTSKNICMHRIVGTNNYYCDQCSDTLRDGPTWDQLRRHHFSHLPFTSYFQCAFCITQKSFKTDLFLHFIKYHRVDYLKNKKYICAPDEWAGPAKEATLRQIQIYTNDDNLTVIAQKERSEVRQAVQTLHNIGTEMGLQETGNKETKDVNGDSEVTLTHPLEENAAAPSNAQVEDILQKALSDSCINLEDEICNTLTPAVNGYKNIIVVDVKPQQQPVAVQQPAQLNDMEIEEICQEMFEEIENEVETRFNGRLKTNNKNNRIIDLQKKEMQKYINYLCPECKREFDDQPTWRSHVFKEHNLAQAIKTKFRPVNSQKTAHLCLTCCQVQRNSKNVDLQRHYFQHMPHQGYLKCTLCKKTKSSKPKMLLHLEFIHRIEIPKAVDDDSTDKVELAQCLECDIMFEEDLQSHLRICPARLGPLAVEQYNDIAKNKKLLEHLQNASRRIDKMLLEVGIDASSL